MPTDEDWIQLLEFIGDRKSFKLKATTGWIRPHTKNNNSTGFSAIPSGYRKSNGTFDEIDSTCTFWTTTTDVANVSVYNFNSAHYSANVVKDSKSKKHAYSIRCIKD